MNIDNIVEYVLYLERKVQRLEQIIEQLRGSIEQQRTESSHRHRDESLSLDHLPCSNE